MESLIRAVTPLKQNLDKYSTLGGQHPSDYDSSNLDGAGASLEDTGWYLCSKGELSPSEDCEKISEVDELDSIAVKQLDLSGKYMYSLRLGE